MFLPEELVVEIIARVPKHNDTTLSLVSKHFRSLVASPEVHAKRSLLGSKYCVYAVLWNRQIGEKRLYILRPEPDNMNRFVLVPSLPVMPHGGTYVIGRSMIYVLDSKTSNGFSIDCSSHTVQPLPSLPMPMTHNFAKFIDGKLYVTRKCSWETRLSHKVMVFDTETWMWEPDMTKPKTELCDKYPSYCVMSSYDMRSSKDRPVFGPKQYQSEIKEMLNTMRFKSICVVDDIWYHYDDHENKLKAYDPKQRCWIVVKGVENLLHHVKNGRSSSQTVNYGGNLAVLVFGLTASHPYTSIICAEIALEIRHDGEIMGKVERRNAPLTGLFTFVKLLTVIV